MQHFDIVIETPKSSAQKYAYDPATRFFILRKVLPEGMCFPFDFGFIPGTKGQDSDPLDVIIISEFKTFPGCMINCRIIGCISAEEQDKESRKKIRNDRFVAVPVVSTSFKNIKRIDQLPKKMTDQLEDFFVHYNKEENKKFTVVEMVCPQKAITTIQTALAGSDVPSVSQLI